MKIWIDFIFLTERIGFAIARRLAREGARVVISSRKQENVEAAVASLKKENLDIYGTVCHVSKADDRKRLFEETIAKYGKLDILVSNAAVSPSFGNIFEVKIKYDLVEISFNKKKQIISI